MAKGAFALLNRSVPRRRRLLHRLYRASALLLLALALFCYLLFVLERQIRPVLLNIVEYECGRYAMTAFTDAADENLHAHPESYQQLYTLQYDAAGNIVSVTANAYAVNQIQSQLSAAIAQKLYALDQMPLSVPLGTLFGIQVLAGRGPRLNLRVEPESYVETEIYDTLETAGINQIKLTLYARFTMNMSVVLSGYSTSVSVSNDQFLGQFLIAGNTPQVYYSGIAPVPGTSAETPGW